MLLLEHIKKSIVMVSMKINISICTDKGGHKNMKSEFLHLSLDRLHVCLSVHDQNTKTDR